MPTLSKLYGFLFALSLALISPWGENRGEIWTNPKVLVVFLITLLNCLVSFHAYTNCSLFIGNTWKIGLEFWIIFLGLGLISTILSPFPLHSLWGNSVLGDGWIYWVLIGIFTLSNSLVLQLHPALFRAQLYGVLVGGLVVSLSIIPQMFDWRIDYTITSGQITSFNPQRLASSIWKSQMPIGLYSNRGHTAFVIATTAILSILANLWKWISPIIFKPIFSILLFTLILTQTRAGILAFLISAAYLILRCDQKSRAHLISSLFSKSVSGFRITLIIICSISLVNFTRLLDFAKQAKVDFFSINHLETVSKGRFHLLNLGFKGIAEKPLLGWGFDGLGIAFPHIGDWTGIHKAYLINNIPVDKVLSLGDFTFSYEGVDGSLHLGMLLTNKAHNLIIDSILSIGMIGFISVLMLFGFFIWNASKSILWGIEAVSIVYIIYTLFWFESAQYSHLFWWSLCFWNKSVDT
jgi:O-Antigen ligase